MPDSLVGEQILVNSLTPFKLDPVGSTSYKAQIERERNCAGLEPLEAFRFYLARTEARSGDQLDPECDGCKFARFVSPQSSRRLVSCPILPSSTTPINPDVIPHVDTIHEIMPYDLITDEFSYSDLDDEIRESIYRRLCNKFRDTKHPDVDLQLLEILKNWNREGVERFEALAMYESLTRAVDEFIPRAGQLQGVGWLAELEAVSKRINQLAPGYRSYKQDLTSLDMYESIRSGKGNCFLVMLLGIRAAELGLHTKYILDGNDHLMLLTSEAEFELHRPMSFSELNQMGISLWHMNEGVGHSGAGMHRSGFRRHSEFNDQHKVFETEEAVMFFVTDKVRDLVRNRSVVENRARGGFYE